MLGPYYEPLPFALIPHAGHFVLAKSQDRIPRGWTVCSLGTWHLGVVGLPVRPIHTARHDHIGWCVGFPVPVWPEPLNLSLRLGVNGSLDMLSLEKFYEDTGGRYLLLVFTPRGEHLFLDPAGSLAAVYSTREMIVASTPLLIGSGYQWDTDLIEVLDIPQSDRWFPSGLTPHQGIRRLLPNHTLNLGTWTVARHWPPSPSALSVTEDTDHAVHSIVSTITGLARSVAAEHPITVSLTAGRDSRMILACLRDLRDRDLLFVTHWTDATLIDRQVARILARRFRLQHKMLAAQYANNEELRCWLYLTGHCVSGAVWKLHKTGADLDRRGARFEGIAGEVGRAYYWRDRDRPDSALTEDELLRRAQLPHRHERMRAETATWLSELAALNTLNILDLFYLEQRVGCWASPSGYGLTPHSITPFNNRRIFTAMMCLPYAYRFEQELARAVCRAAWPELLTIPFNELSRFAKLLTQVKGLPARAARKAMRLAHWR